MSRRTEVCRDFVRGSCRFGSRCKFLHDSSQQQRQQPSNPFGFGVKNQGQQQQPAFSKGGNYYAPSTSTQRQQKNQSQTHLKEHRCSDPRECKLQIKEDLQNEQPVYWRLTSYAHGKYLPNDVTGDVSFEELRNYAYDAGKQGMLFENVVQNERNMLIAKNMEFEILLKNPYTGPTPSGNSFQGSGTLSPFASAPSDAPKLLFGTSAPGYSSSSFGASSHPTGPSQDSFQSRGAFGGGFMKESGGFSFGLGASSTPANDVSASSPFTSPSLPASGFSFGVQSFGPGPSTQLSPPQIAFGSNLVVYPSFGQNTLQMSNSVGDSSGASRNLFGSKDSFQGVKENEIPSSLFSFQNGPPSTVKMSSETLVNQTMRETTSQIMPAGHPGPPTEKADIWLKESWALGEIPDEEPPVFAR